MAKNIQMKIKEGTAWVELYPKTKAALVDDLSDLLGGKVDKVSGKGLSTEDFTTLEKSKLSNIEANANNYVHPTTAGNRHIPTGGAAGNVLKYGGSSGTAAWGALVADDIPTLSLSKISGLGSAASANTGNAQGNVPILGAGGKLDTSILPALAISDTFVVASQAAMLALTAETGDVAVRTDIHKSFILRQSPATTLANWQELLNPESPVQSVAGKTGAVSLSKTDVGLGNVDNTSDANKPVSSATQTALNGKVDKVSGKELSTNDYTDAEKLKLSGIAAGANNYVHPASHPASIITQDVNNRFVTDLEKAAWNGKSNLTLGTTSVTAYRGDLGTIAYNHSQAAHAPSNAQKNSDITKAEIEAKLTGNVNTHNHIAVQATEPTGVDFWYQEI